MSAPPGVPVFNCVVNITRPAADGAVVATVANLAGISARGQSEREVLTKVIPLFKDAVARLHAAGQPMPWLDPPTPPATGETQRLIAVHL